MPGVHAYKEAYFVGVGMFPAGQYPALPTVDQAFSGELDLVLSDGRTLVVANGGIELDPETGRTHQIRVHMAHIRAPLLGDPVYGGRPRLPHEGAGDGTRRPAAPAGSGR